MSKSVSRIIFHENTEEASTGDVFNTFGQAKDINIQFLLSNGGSFTARIMVKLMDENTWYPYPCFQYPKYTLIDSVDDLISTDEYIYNVNLSSVESIRVEILTITGVVSVFGMAVGYLE